MKVRMEMKKNEYALCSDLIFPKDVVILEEKEIETKSKRL